MKKTYCYEGFPRGVADQLNIDPCHSKMVAKV